MIQSEEPGNQQGLTAQWPTMAAKVLKVDEDKVQDCKEDIDTLMVFVSTLGILETDLTVIN